MALAALVRWQGDPSTLEFIGTSGNAVYSYYPHGGSGAPHLRRILRLTDPNYRSRAHNEAEMQFLVHLKARGASVNVPQPSAQGAWVEEVTVGEETALASVLSWTPGVLVDIKSPLWNRRFLEEWGRSLARIHAAASTYEGPRRWEWDDEDLLRDAEDLLPPQDRFAREELATAMEKIRRLPQTRANYGINHADYAPQNFRYDPPPPGVFDSEESPVGRITAFDFGNCCQHFFVSDLSISLLQFRRDPERDRYRRWLLDAYREVFPIDEQVYHEMVWFMRLRILYVYLSRLCLFGKEPTEKQRAILSNLRLAVEERFRWR